jgi:hypothetical protein
VDCGNAGFVRFDKPVLEWSQAEGRKGPIKEIGPAYEQARLPHFLSAPAVPEESVLCQLDSRWPERGGQRIQ